MIDLLQKALGAAASSLPILSKYRYSLCTTNTVH